jgi:HAE1 family hydrophobic/amphiphilic exporter-1
MSITKLALKRPVSVVLLLVSLFVFGIGSIGGFDMAYTPQLDRPMFVIVTPYNGADPEIVDSTVTGLIEDLGTTLNGFEQSVTASVEGSSRVRLEFQYGTDMNETYMDLKTAIDQLRLPEGTSSPTIMQISSSANSMMDISVTTSGDADLLDFVNNVLVPSLQTLSGVADVNIFGGTSQYVQVLLDETAMKQYGVSMSDISSAITAASYSVPAGNLSQGSQNISLSAGASPTDLYELSHIPLSTSTNNVITLSDVAEISMAAADAGSINRFNGIPNVGVSITNSQDASIPDVSYSVRKTIAELQSEYPDIQMSVVSDSSEKIQSAISSVATTLVMGVILCMLVLFLFLGDLKASLIVGSSIPLSLLVTLICMSLCGFELNLITTSSLVIAIGMMVDNSIVVLESIFLEQEKKTSFSEAAIQGCKTVGASVIASTITTIVVYLPLAFLPGLAGQLFSTLGYTIVFAMVASLVSAITLVPLFYCFFKPTERKTSPVSKLMARLMAGYDKLVRKVLRRKMLAIIIAVFSLAGAIFLALQISVEILPAIDEGVMQITASYRSGTKLEVVDEGITEIEQMISEDSRFNSYSLSIKNNTATIKAFVGGNTPTESLVNEYTAALSDTPNMNIDISSVSLTGTISRSSASVTLSGYDYAALKAAAEDFQNQMYNIPGVIKVNSSVSGDATSAEIKIDPLKAAYYGLNANAIAKTIRSVNNGTNAGTINIGGDEFTITVEYPQGKYDDYNAMMAMPLSSKNGSITLSDIAELQFTDTLQSVNRVSGVYYIDLDAVCLKENIESLDASLKALHKQADYGSSVTVGKSLTQGALNAEIPKITGAIGVAAFLVFIVMAMQFESVRFSLMVMTSVVFSFIGSFALLFFSGIDLTLVSLVGILMLIGIVVNNGILFVDTTNALKAEMPLEDALVQSGKIRMRPILMTTLTTILSMIPLALGIGKGSQLLQSMGIVIVGGLITSTILVLLLMPTFYIVIGKKLKHVPVMVTIDRKKE